MRKRFTEEQIVRILREAEGGGGSIRDVIRRHGITETTYYRWRRKFGDLGAQDAARLKILERENARLKKMVAERDLEIEVLKEINGKKW